MIINLINRANEQLGRLNLFAFTAPLLMRLFLAPVFWMAGTNKINHIDSTIAWLGNSEGGLACHFLLCSHGWLQSLRLLAQSVCWSDSLPAGCHYR